MHALRPLAVRGQSIVAASLLTARTAPTTATACASAAAMQPLLCTFDVDGTLIHAVGENANKLHKRAFSHAFKEVYGVTASIDEIEARSALRVCHTAPLHISHNSAALLHTQHHGSTDFLVTLAVLQYKGIPIQEAVPHLPRVADSMLKYCKLHADSISEGLDVLPGVADLLAALAKRQNCVTGLVTGNLEDIGWAKMAALGLKKHFTMPLVGGFSSDYCSNQLDDHSIDRAEFIRVAARKAIASGRLSGPPRIVHFGDTPNDVKAAAAAGAVPVGLATGAFSLDQLRATAEKLGVQRSAILLADLRDTKAVLAALE